MSRRSSRSKKKRPATGRSSVATSKRPGQHAVSSRGGTAVRTNVRSTWTANARNGRRTRRDDDDCPHSSSPFSSLDQDCRLKIFGYLTWEDLARVSPTCRQVRDDCQHPTLPLRENRQTFVLYTYAKGRVSVFFRRLVALADQGTFLARFTTVKVVQCRELDGTERPNMERIRGTCTIPEITSLEISYQESQQQPRQCNKGRWYTDLRASWMWESLAGFFPNVRHLTVTDPRVSASVPAKILRRCHRVHSFAWHGMQSSPFLDGRGLCVGSHALREVYLDNSIFDETLSFNAESCFYSHDPGSVCIMWQIIAWRGHLERLSIKNAKYRTCRSHEEEPQVLDVPQEGLIKFVRRPTTLRWIRIALTPDNVTMLQQERPDVTFMS